MDQKFNICSAWVSVILKVYVLTIIYISILKRIDQNKMHVQHNLPDLNIQRCSMHGDLGYGKRTIL